MPDVALTSRTKTIFAATPTSLFLPTHLRLSSVDHNDPIVGRYTTKSRSHRPISPATASHPNIRRFVSISLRLISLPRDWPPYKPPTSLWSTKAPIHHGHFGLQPHQ
ncbi:unnamed protein product [Zymoseptoria tritici ST99CH_3D7]|uniref:Uncharacterized protein n=1 Tax=Zymoseptoria tritici (strain ST99CH_3D7) TaxID=1276538 RepID=A0A1X7RXT7_ZYMT9|nr:unnamed protein product [Zymoseptoria tritici ST99CH_3D7]